MIFTAFFYLLIAALTAAWEVLPVAVFPSGITDALAWCAGELATLWEFVPLDLTTVHDALLYFVVPLIVTIFLIRVFIILFKLVRGAG